MTRAQTLAKARAQSRKGPQTKSPRETGALPTGKNLNIVLCVLLAAVTIAIYSPVFGYGFVILDDQEYVTGNPHVQNGLAWSTIKWAFTSTETAAYWHPLTWLSHALDYQLFGLDAAGHHFHNVLIHALNAVLLFLLLQWMTRRVGPSLLVAALFAVHPLNVESVAWVAERKNVLCTLFFLLAIAAYVRYVRRPDWRRYLLVAALFAAGLMAKPMVITLPFVLLLLDYWPLERISLDGTESGPDTSNELTVFLKLLLEKVPLLLLSAGSAAITLIAQRPAERTLETSPLGMRVENAVVSYGLYLWKMVWPARLAGFYPHSANGLPMWQVILSTLTLLVITGLVLVFRSKRYLPVGWFWFLGTLIPVIGLVQAGAQAMADRFAYIPLIGIFVAIAWALDDWANAKRVSTAWRLIPALCVLLVLGIITARQLSYWESQYALWSRSLAVEENPIAHNALAYALLVPGSQMSQHDLENLDTEQKRTDEARRHLDRVLEQCHQQVQWGPDVCLLEMATALSNLETMDRNQNRPEETLRQDYEEALKIDRQLGQRHPRGGYRTFLAATLFNLAGLDLRQNRMDEGRQHYEEAVEIDRQMLQQNLGPSLPDMATALVNLGVLNQHQNRTDEGRQDYEEALKLYRQLEQQNPGAYLQPLAATLNNLGNLEGRQNRIEDSRVHYTEAMTIYQTLAQGDARYAADAARTAASLEALGKKAPAR